ncbi:MAG: 3-deoxy-7-phosphoheptulonate synthase [Myxococcota bacterium]
MQEPIEDRNVVQLRPLRSPRGVKSDEPPTPRAVRIVGRTRAAISDILHGQDPRRLVVVVGPCSIHDADQALEYAERLLPVARACTDELLVVMRTYFEKPRTTVGWKGFLNDPHLDGSCDVGEGLRLARRLLLEIHEIGVPCATELLDPVTPQYLADLVSWAAIGARTSESQTHREMASGLSMPVGFKNGTDGSLESAVNAMTSARAAHSFLGIDPYGRAGVVHTRGNSAGHVVLRGGRGGPNYGPAHVARAAELCRKHDLARPVMVDCSHDNSGQDPTRQPAVCRALLEQVGDPALMGVLLESHLRPGRQDFAPGAPLEHGVSITDGCIGFEETATLLYELAEAVRCASPRPARRRTLAEVG